MPAVLVIVLPKPQTAPVVTPAEPWGLPTLFISLGDYQCYLYLLYDAFLGTLSGSQELEARTLWEDFFKQILLQWG